MNYDEYAYLWPPRPETKVPQATIPFYEKRGYWAQVKKNGTCTVIFARGLEVIFKTRHNDDHKQWSPLPEHVRFFQSASTKWNVFVAELIHSKTPHIKNQLYIFDVLVLDGVHLEGTTFEERQKLLIARWPNAVDEGDQFRINPYVSYAKNYTKDFAKLFTSLKPEDEGLVMKQPTAKMRACFKPDSNSAWQVKSRVPTKNYGF